MIAPGTIPEVSPLLDEDMRKQIGDVFSKLHQDVWLLTIVDLKDEKCVELASLLKDMERQGEKSMWSSTSREKTFPWKKTLQTAAISPPWAFTGKAMYTPARVFSAYPGEKS